MCFGKLQHDAVDLQFCICSYNLLSKSNPPSTYRVMICNNISVLSKQTHFLFVHNLSTEIFLFVTFITLHAQITTTMMRIIASISYRVA